MNKYNETNTIHGREDAFYVPNWVIGIAITVAVILMVVR